MGGKNSRVYLIPEQDPIQDALEKTKKTTYFKLTPIWASGTPEQFLLHVCTAIQVCKQIGFDTNYANAPKLDATKTKDDQLASATKRKQKS